MNSNFSQNATVNQVWSDRFWTYVYALSPLLCVFLLTVGNLLIVIEIHRRTLRSLTFDLITQLLLCDIFLVGLLQVVMVSWITKFWVLSNTFCCSQGMAIQIISMLSCFLRMVLVFERFSVVVRKRGMKISRGTGLAVSIIFLGIAVIIALFPEDQKSISRKTSLHIEGFHSCYVDGEWLPVSTNLAVLAAPCIIIVIISLMSFHIPPLCKGATVAPTELSFTRNSVSVSSMRMMYLESTAENFSNQSCNDSISIYEIRTTLLLPMLNIAVTIIAIIRLCLMVASRHVQSDETFQTAILVCYIIQCTVQTVVLLTASFRSKKAIQKSLHLEPQSSNELQKSVPKDQPLTLIPRDSFACMPEFLKVPSNVDVRVEQTNDYSRCTKRVSLPLISVISSINLDTDRASIMARRRVTINVM